MPEERDIEKSLRAWARRRREDAGAPVELHPATRRLLQAEVSRLRGGAHRTPGPLARLLWGSPLRLALNLAAAAMVVVAVALLLPQFRRSPSQTAPVLLTQADRELETASEPAGPAAAKDQLSAPQPASPSLQDASKKVAGEPIPATNGPVALAYNRSLIEALASQNASVPQPVAPPQPPVLVQDKPVATNTAVFTSHDGASATTRSLDGAVIAQKFLRLRSPAADTRSQELADLQTGPEALLGSFQMEQTGEQLRVTDADGSVYTGSLTAPDNLRKSDAAGAPAPSRSFRVSGTNLTRNQLVVFTGSLVLDNQTSLGVQTESGNVNNIAPGGAVGGGGFGGAAATFKFARQTNAAAAPPVAAPAAVTAAAAGTPMPLRNFRIAGQAVIGTNEIQINAVPSKP